MTMPTTPERVESPAIHAVSRPSYEARALAIWPRIDARRLRRTKGDPMRIARLIEARTSLTFEEILRVLGVATAD